jgi:hypothetical protein
VNGVLQLLEKELLKKWSLGLAYEETPLLTTPSVADRLAADFPGWRFVRQQPAA